MSCGLFRSLDDAALTIAAAAVHSRVAHRKRRLAARVQHYLMLHVSERVRLQDVARAMGASSGYVSEVFREIVGVPPYQYQLQLRLTRATELLGTQDDLARLALDLGFSSHSHFTTAFRHRFGDTPGSFRARVRRERNVRSAPPKSQIRAAAREHRPAPDSGSISKEQRP